MPVLQQGIRAALKRCRAKNMPVSVGKNKLVPFALNRTGFGEPYVLQFGMETLIAAQSARILGI